MLSLAARHKYNLGISLNWILEKLTTRTGVLARGSVDVDPLGTPQSSKKRMKVAGARARLLRTRNKGT